MDENYVKIFNSKQIKSTLSGDKMWKASLFFFATIGLTEKQKIFSIYFPIQKIQVTDVIVLSTEKATNRLQD
jgi:hypothetical protein